MLWESVPATMFSISYKPSNPQSVPFCSNSKRPELRQWDRTAGWENFAGPLFVARLFYL